MTQEALPTDDTERKATPMATGLLDYFPAALAEVARLSKYGNDKHNPGEELHHARGKSTDHADCAIRHLVDRGIIEVKSGFSHTTMAAWRTLALLQEECEAEGAPLARGARRPGFDHFLSPLQITRGPIRLGPIPTEDPIEPLREGL